MSYTERATLIFLVAYILVTILSMFITVTIWKKVRWIKVMKK